jgi:uracil-DNA glycosylase
VHRRVSRGFDALLDELLGCRRCAEALPLGPRPIVQLHPEARVLIASQAPGRIAHERGVPFQDPSGRRLRTWMGVDEVTFYDPRCIAILPMGFCYPGAGPGGDAPPRPECAPFWRRPVLDALAGIRLTLLIGRHAQDGHLPTRPSSVAAAVQRGFAGDAAEQEAVLCLPHPSPRNNRWLARHPWFERELVPQLRDRVAAALDDR